MSVKMPTIVSGKVVSRVSSYSHIASFFTLFNIHSYLRTSNIKASVSHTSEIVNQNYTCSTPSSTSLSTNVVCHLWSSPSCLLQLNQSLFTCHTSRGIPSHIASSLRSRSGRENLWAHTTWRMMLAPGHGPSLMRRSGPLRRSYSFIL